MIISEIDKLHYNMIRDNIDKFIELLSVDYDKSHLKILDIAPQVHKGVKGKFKNAKVSILDIDPESKADYILNLCKNNSDIILDNTFDLVVCTEVLEHTENPFAAVDELYRISKIDGTVAVSTPFNFRIHRPLPDNWRFTIHGLNILFKKFKSVTIIPLEDPNRNLMPIQYTILARK